MIRDQYLLTAMLSALLWLTGTIFLMFPESKKKLRVYGHLAFIAGTLILSSFITLKWMELQRPLFGTIGETRIWSGLLLILAGDLLYLIKKYRWVLVSSTILAILILSINVISPENFNLRLIPAMKSPWLIIHASLYLLAYATLTMAAIFTVRGIFKHNQYKSGKQMLLLTDRITYAGVFLLTLGLVSGAIWAKEAWGHYWTWDPKETLSLISWLFYVIVLHLIGFFPSWSRFRLGFYLIAFGILILCWMGIQFIPGTQHSIHLFF